MESSVGYLPTIRISSGCKETRGSDNSLSFFCRHFFNYRRGVPLPPPSDWGQRAEMKPVQSER